MEMFGVSMDEGTKRILEDLAKEIGVSRSAALRLTVRFAVKHHEAFRFYARRFVRRKRCEASAARGRRSDRGPRC
jgi:DNA-binding MurR/RpiR family transcriptional regulator